MFVDEAEIAVQLDHQILVGFFDLGTDDAYFIAMEYVSGHDVEPFLTVLMTRKKRSTLR